MGLDLRRITFEEWTEEQFGPAERRQFYRCLEKHLGRPLATRGWSKRTEGMLRIGSYTSYGALVDCLWYLTRGLEGFSSGEGDEIDESEVRAFTERLPRPKTCAISHAEHFLDAGDADTIFIPIMFDAPFEFHERYVSSKRGAEKALIDFAAALGFSLNSRPEPESDDEGRWLPIMTAKNHARAIARFFEAISRGCVELA